MSTIERSDLPARADFDSNLRLSAAIALAWAGFFIHNVADLPSSAILGPESLLPTLVWLTALTMWLVPPSRKAGVWALLVWAIINLVGGALSVLPLAVLPFEPEQTFRHYAFHGVYAATQVPLIVMTAARLRRR